MSPARRPLLVLVLATLSAQGAAQERPSNLILFVGDGYGPSYAELGRAVGGAPLAMDATLVGSAQTAAVDSRVADSAAGATAYACGIATQNAHIAVDEAGRACRTLLQAAQSAGRAVGIVTTTRVTHATPAAFIAHHVDRSAEEDIAAQMAGARLDVIFGGGARYFQPAGTGGARDDERDLLQELSSVGYTVVTDPTCFETIDALPAIALLADSHLAYEIDRDETGEPSLASMTTRAVDLLHSAGRPFVLMVEGGRIDHAGHSNAPAEAAADVLAYDAAFRVAVEWAREHGGTLVVGVSDHETGGLGLGRDDVYDWKPQVLRAATEGVGRMAERIAAGEDIASVVASGAGIDSLGASEMAELSTRDVRDVIARIQSERAGVSWTTAGHTATDVPVYAFGPGAAEFAGSRTAAAVGRLLFEAMGLAVR